MIEHPERARVADIVVWRAGKEPTRGTGYLVSPGRILTACHVVDGAASIGVWLGAPAELAPETVFGSVDVSGILAVAGADLALLPVTGYPDDPSRELVLFGRLDWDSPVPVPAAAVGCPRFKLRPDPARQDVQLRELHYAGGRIAPMSNAKTATHEFAVKAVPGPDPAPDEHSPWEGMSGAGVWSSGRLVGVVGQHHPREGRGILTVRPIEQLFRYASAAQLKTWRLELSQLPPAIEGLRLLTSLTAREITERRTQRTVEFMAPSYLFGRTAELAALEDFATGSVTSWRWIQGDAFAGKTALLAWFALYPPERVDVASCFLRRVIGDNTASYALNILNRQLATLARGPDYSPPQLLSDQSDDFAGLLEKAARACAEGGRRLLVLIDGLDEYDPTIPSRDLATWLPDTETLPDQAMLVVSSRAGTDVSLPSGHRLFSSVRRISASEAASEIQAAAHAELKHALRAPGEFLYPLVCCLAVAGSGLTSSELCALLKLRGRDRDVSEIEAVLGGSLRGSLLRQPDIDNEDTGVYVYVFAHDTLLAEARHWFTADLATYKDLFDKWADEYIQRGWSADTPRYLLRPYTRLLARTRTVQRLVQIVTDSGRHERMLAATATDAAALAEILDARDLLLDNSEPDLAALGLVAAEAFRLSMRNATLPEELPALWVRLGRPDRAESLARAFSSADRRATALAGVATALAAAGQKERAEQLARIQQYWQVGALTSVATALAAAGQAERAEQLARTISHPYDQARALGGVAAALVAGGQSGRAEELARTIAEPYPYGQAAALAGVAAALAAAGQVRRAEQLAVEAEQLALAIPDPEQISRQEVLTEVAASLAKAGQGERAEQLARSVIHENWLAGALVKVAAGLAAAGEGERAGQLALEILDHGWHPGGAAEVAAALAAVGQVGEAEQLARRITDPLWQAHALADTAAALAAAGQEQKAGQLAAEAEYLARTVPHPEPGFSTAARLEAGMQGQALADIAAALVAAGQTQQAERLARATAVPAFTLTIVATALAAAGDRDRAEQVAVEAEQLSRHPSVGTEEIRALDNVVAALLVAGCADKAEQLARIIPDRHGWALARVAVALVGAGDWKRAEQLGHTIPEPYGQALALTRVAAALVAAGQAERAERLARTITYPDWQREKSLTDVAMALFTAGQPERAVQLITEAEELARASPEPFGRSRGLTNLAVALVGAGQTEQAEQLALSIPDPGWGGGRSGMLAEIAEALAAAGQGEQAERLATEAEHLARTINDPNVQAATLANVAKALAAAGQVERALRLVSTIPDKQWQEEALASAAVALVTAGQGQRAERLARTITDNQFLLAPALGSVAAALARIGQGQRAELLARTITEPGRDEALASVALALAGAEEGYRAGRLAQAITNPDIQARTLADVAETLSRLDFDPQHARSRRILARLLASSSWHYAMPVLASLDPVTASRTGMAILDILKSDQIELQYSILLPLNL